MRIVVDVKSPVYPYVQIADQLREAIASGEITDLVPSYWDLVREIGVSYNTVRRAVDLLKREGLVVTIPGRGTFVKREGAQG